MTRLIFVAVIAVFINGLIFSTIEYMVGSKRIRLTDVENVEIANFIRMTEQSAEVRSRREPTAPAKPQQDLQQNIERLASASSTGAGGLEFSAPDLDVDLGPAIAGDIRIARELNPLVRVPPDYPPYALGKRIEGYVLLRFVVNETGGVEEPEVLRAEPPGVFEKAAKRAVLRWKYQPQIRDGRPASIVTMNRIVFKLDLSQEAQG